jgi:hypothetical protein
VTVTRTGTLYQAADMLRNVHGLSELADKFEAAARGSAQLTLAEADLEVLCKLTLPAEVFAMLPCA